MRLLRRALRMVLLTIMLILCAALFYLLVIMGDAPGGDVAAAPTATAVPLVSMPQPKLSFTGDDLYQATAYFNAPVLQIPPGNGWLLSEVVVSEGMPGGTSASVREIRLLYTDAASDMAVYVSSLTPASALRTLPARGFFATADQDVTLLGQRAVLMRSGQTLHVHLQRGEIIYQIEGDVGLEVLCGAAGIAGI